MTQLEILSTRQLLADSKMSRDNLAWRRHIKIALYTIGSIQILAGIMFFFAFNWDDIHKFTKLGLIAGAEIICFALWWLKGNESLSGKALGAACTFLVGVFMATFGQIYQTGADSYELFTAWALFATLFMLAGQNTAQYALWYIIINLAIFTSMAQWISIEYTLSTANYCLVIALVNGIANLILIQLTAFNKCPLPRWLFNTLTSWFILLISIMNWVAFIDIFFERNSNYYALINAALGMGVLVYYVRKLSRDKNHVALSPVALAGVVSSLAVMLISMIMHDFNVNFIFGFMLSAVICILGTYIFVQQSKALLSKHQEASHD